VKRCEYDFASGTVTVEVDEGRAWHLQTTGLKRTRPSFVRDRVHFSPGQKYSVRAAEDTYRDLYGSGLFKRVAVNFSPSDSGATVHVAVEEQNSLLLKLGYRWDDEYHSEGFAEALENNMFGIGVVAFGRARIAERRKRYSAGMKTDRFFRTYVAFDLQAYGAKYDRRLFLPDGTERGLRDEDRIGASFRLAQQIARFGAVSAGTRIESVETFSRADSTREDYELRALKLSSLVEDLDRTYFPNDGRRNHFSFESAGKVFGGVTEYNKWYFSIEHYFPLGSRLNVRPRFVGATSSAGLPAAERFYIGGLDSFEGLRTEEVSGAKVLLVNLQVRYQVYPRTFLIARYNSGNTYEQTEDVSLENVRSGWAALAGFDSIGGPIIFGYGRANGDRDRFYFNAGLRF
ncbi:MAG: BamA/TamA family outer membrane protein, partial [Candidatus Zixiibacteriota bacterium]